MLRTHVSLTGTAYQHHWIVYWTTSLTSCCGLCLQGDIQRLIKKAAAAEEATSAAQTAAAEAQQAVSAIEGELKALKAARGRVEGELRQQLHELRSERDAEVAALVQKLERALATCDK